MPDYEKYANSPWNLCNLVDDDKTLFKWLDGHISGVKVPWVYVGHLFSTFAWHTEDHWASAINYCHYGDPKIWYTAPASQAIKLEAAMRKYAADSYSRDIVHHVTTTLNPHILVNEGVKLCKAVQNPGEYIIQFGRCYHTGYNSGFNFAEAVNLCTADWARMGRCALTCYRRVKRFNIFAHDELICKASVDYTKITIDMAEEINNDLKQARDFEKRMRKRIMNSFAITRTRKEMFEDIEFDNRQCEQCQMLLFLSAIKFDPIGNVEIGVKSGAMYCLHHADIARGNGEHFILLYRYSIEDINGIVDRLNVHMGKYGNWAENVLPSLTDFKEKRDAGAKYSIPERQEIMQTWKKGLDDAEECKFPKSLKYWRLKSTYTCVDGADDIIDKILDEEELIEFDEIKNIIFALNAYPIFFDELEVEVTDFVEQAAEFIAIVEKLKKGFDVKNHGIYDLPTLQARLPAKLYPALKESLLHGWPIPTQEKLTSYLEQYKSKTPNINHATCTDGNETIKSIFKTIQWHKDVAALLNSDRSIVNARVLLESATHHNSCIGTKNMLTQFIDRANGFDSKCSAIFKANPPPSIELLTSLEMEASSDIELNNRDSLNGLKQIGSTIDDITAWREKVRQYVLPQEIHSFDLKPTYDYVKILQSQGLFLHVRDLGRDLEILEERMITADCWISQCENLFIPKMHEGLLAPYDLQHILIPCYTYISSKAKSHTIDDQARWTKFNKPISAVQQIFNQKSVKSLRPYTHNGNYLEELVKKLKSELLDVDHLPKEYTDTLKTGMDMGVSMFNASVHEEFDRCQVVRAANSLSNSFPSVNADMSNPYTCTCACKLNSDTKKLLSRTELEAHGKKQTVRCCLCLKFWHRECIEFIAKKWDWFPVPFVDIDTTANRRPTRSASQSSMNSIVASIIGKFMCPLCQKSSRPTPENLLTLLLALEKLEVQIFEGQLVQNIIERFLDWQGRTKRTLNQIGKIDPVTNELLNITQNTQDYPDKLRNWIKNNCNQKTTRNLIHNNRKHGEGIVVAKSIPPKLPASILNDLINIQVEGDLIEVKLPESDILWLVVKRFDLVPAGCDI